MDQLEKCRKKSCSQTRELLGPTPTHTMKLCQGKQIGENQRKEAESVTERDKEKKEREKLP